MGMKMVGFNENGEVKHEAVKEGFDYSPAACKDMAKVLSELKANQAELEIQNENLIVSEKLKGKATQRYYSLYNDAPVGYVNLDGEGIIKDCNLKAIEFLGMPKAMIINKPFVLYIDNEYHEEFFKHLNRAFYSEGQKVCEIKLKATGNRNLFVQLVSSVSRELEDEPDICLTAIIDISEHFKIMNELKSAIEETERAYAAKDVFLANMSHEIRTPLNGVMGMTEIILRTELNDVQKSYVESIRTSSKVLLKIINDIFDYSNVWEKNLEVIPEEINLKRMINDVTSSMINDFLRKKIKYSSSIDEDLPDLLRGDSAKIRKILENLMDNALKFTQNGSITLKVSSAERSGKRISIRFDIKDTGIGIPVDKQDMLFKVFSQIDSSYTKRFSGTGVGLSICKKMVDVLGGSIWVKSKEGVGSTFSFVVPLEYSKPEQICIDEVNNSMDTLVKKSKILVVEDDEISSKILVIYLREKNYDVTTARNGKEALELLKGMSFNLILMDIQMPILDGVSTAVIIRSNEAKTNTHTPIIATTAYALRGDREKFINAGMDDYVTKPFDLNELHKKILCLLGIDDDSIKH